MKTRVKVELLGLAVVIGTIVCIGIASTPWSSANLATCHLVEADQLANDSVKDEGDPPVAPVPPPVEVTACDVLFPDSRPFAFNPGLVAVDLVFYGAIATFIYYGPSRRKS